MLLHRALEATMPQVAVKAHEDTAALRFQPRGPRAVHVSFAGGTLLDALDELTRPFAGTWQVGYTLNAAHIVLHATSPEQGSTLVTVAAP